MADMSSTHTTKDAKRNMERMETLKKEGNKEYGCKHYKSALDAYAGSLKSVSIEVHLTPPPPSLMDGTDIEFYRQILNGIELDTFLTDKVRVAISKILSNRAACFLNLKQYIECIHSCNMALLYDADNENALFRRSLCYEYLEKYSISFQNYQKLLQINPQHAKALHGMARIQAVMRQKTDRITTCTESIDALKSLLKSHTAEDEKKIIFSIGLVMNQICESTQHHALIINELGFTHVLYDMLLSDAHSVAIRSDCVHALNGIMKRITNSDKYSKEEQLLVMNSIENGSKNYIKSLLALSETFLSRMDEAQSVLMQLLVEYLIAVAANQYLFDAYGADILQHLLQYFKRLKYNKSRSRSSFISDVLVAILKHLSNAALRHNNTNYKLLEQIRYTFFYHFLFSDFSQDLRIKSEILRYFVCCSGLKSVLDQVNDTKLASLKSKYEERVSDAVKQPIVSALKTQQFTSDNVRLVKALRGLSIVLQSNHKLGEAIASNEDVLNCIVEVATTCEVDPIGYLGCEVLALSCSNAAIRDAIVSSNNQHLFAWILDSEDFMVRGYAANALSKFAAIDEDSRELALGGANKCLVSCCGIIHHLLRNEDADFFEKKTTIDDDDEFRTHKMPLMNLCIESISYLSLHIETKLGLISNDNEMLKLIVSVSSTRYFARNRSLRHGLLTIVLNCCLSKEDVTQFMSEKEEQLHKLKKVVSKGLPNDPTKQDDIIQSRAGGKAVVKTIQKELIKENCIYLVYRIVALTKKENKKIDDYIHEQIGMKKEDEIRMKNREEERRRDRLHWDPDKYSNESEKDKLARKKLHHLNTQKTKYKSFELEEKLQMKICQVLMMISNIAEFRGNLVQQKAIRLSMDLFFENQDKMASLNGQIRQMASVTIARICISINPILLKSNDIAPICACLLKLIDEAHHELYIYEALLALCNIASLPNSDDIKIDIAHKKRGWHTLRNAFEDEHPLINAAILETWCNLCTCYEAGIIKLYQNRAIDIQIVTLFLRHDLRRVQRAAVSILAMATSIMYDPDDDDDDEVDISKAIAKEIAKNGGVVLLQCLINIRQSTLIERFHKDKQKEMQNKELDKIILQRVRIVMANLKKYGYTMHNIDQHGVNKDVIKDFQKVLKK